MADLMNNCNISKCSMIGKEQIELMDQRIQQYNDFIMSQDIEKMPIGLFCGKMGLCIYFYHQSRYTEEKKYKKFADKLLNMIFTQINSKSLISLEDGLIGVCLGLNYLVENGFQSGNINHVLSELDDKIYQTAWFESLKNYSSSPETTKSVFEVALYFSIRLLNSKLDKDNRFLYESIVIKAINHIERTFNNSDIFFEPLTYSLNEYFISSYFYLLAIVYKLGFYNYKIDKIIDESYPKLARTYPLLHCNRLQLSTVLEFLNNELHRKSIDDYVTRLRQDIDYSLMITTEFRNKNLLLANGLCGMYMIQNILFKNKELPQSLIVNRIIQSELWEDIYNDEIKLNATIGLFTGLAGIILTYQNLIKKL